jgi:hypothetical protein
MPSVAWNSAAPKTHGRSRRHVRRGCGKPSASWKKSTASRCRQTAEYEAYRARGVDKTGRRFGRPPKPFTPPETPRGRINITDPDSRNVKTPRGWVQGYNAQAVATKSQTVIAAELTNSSADFGQLGPLVDAARRELVAVGIDDTPDVVLADAGYWHHVQMQSLAAEGLQVLIPPDANKRKGHARGGMAASMPSCAASSQRLPARGSTDGARR